MENTNARLHVFVTGMVQGVGFRFFVYQYGMDLNLQGWVRNRYDGRVEVLAEGPRHVLEAFLGKIKEGPQLAQVKNVEVDWRAANGDLSAFTVLASE